MSKTTIIIVEDNNTMRLGIKETLTRAGYLVFEFDNGIDAENFTDEKIKIAVLDLKMEPIDGIETLRRLKQKNPEIKTLLISAYGTVEDAVKAMQLGASDFLTKPFSPEELRLRINNLVGEIVKEEKINDLLEQNKLLNDQLYESYDDIIGDSEIMKNLFDTVDKVALTNSTVLIQGESGTGKELIARAVHRKSTRADKPFIKLNCGSLNDNLLESELFGHERGSFTGAVKQKKGRFELSNNGTLFLDEIGDLSPTMQVKLLRVLQEGEFERVGGEETLNVDVRIIAATNLDLKQLINNYKFRNDLYYRLSVIPIMLPSLRERKTDIPLLADYFLQKLAAKFKTKRKSIDDNGRLLLTNYSWPGNVRELENLIERLLVISNEDVIDSFLIAKHLNSDPLLHDKLENLKLDEALYIYEKKLIMQAMKKTNGVKNRAAKLLGIKTSAFYYKLEKFGLL
ncbi:MAG: Fis family transcriptional regulator [Ignavibacteriae bacterium HGW-Ignavibacteriae-2]|jgi:DNA-binding NtrC family response regulator|nr:sigma-54 dependent transcriptional regulator [Bacteroidota bacterium]PKL88730.1 MAG: Fis family transcriptional regulator [Ignavibacteriae bacterium HGW-Ignavibacteriae-2]